MLTLSRRGSSWVAAVAIGALALVGCGSSADQDASDPTGSSGDSSSAASVSGPSESSASVSGASESDASDSGASESGASGSGASESGASESSAAGSGAAGTGVSGSGASADSGYPVSIDTSSGTTTLTSAPERVVTLANPAFENVIALGVEPVGATVTNIENLPYLADYVDADYLDPSLSDPYANEINYEAILALKPDLIVAPAWPMYTDEAVKERLGQIAPTLVFDLQNAQTDWRVGVQQVARALNKADLGEQLIDTAVTAFAEAGAAHPAIAEHDYSFGLYYNSEITLGSGGNILRLFGMKPSAGQTEVEDSGETPVFSGESIGDVDGDLVILMPSPREAAATLEESPAWDGNLDSRVIWISDAQGEAINNAGILGKSWVPGDFESVLAEFD